MRARPLQRGVSLMEALVALVVMAVGMLGYVGLQSGLRLNGDVAKQRSEAVRIAQEAIETWRAYSLIDPNADETDYQEIAGVADITITSEATNATYTLSRTVIDSAVDAAAPRLKTLLVDVAWEDRAGGNQSVRLRTAIAESPPELAGTLSVPPSGNPRLGPFGRHPAIPVDAVIQGTSSRFTPPQPVGGELSWVFDNQTGVITNICNPAEVCTETHAFLLSGFVRFATGPAQATGADAEAPLSPALPVGIEVQRTFPGPELVVSCYEDQRAGDVRYFCAVPVDEAHTPPRWAGRSRVTGLLLAASVADATDTAYRICRYTPYRDHRAVGSGTPPMRNRDHPLDYGAPAPDAAPHGVVGPLTNQNFLVIRAGFVPTPEGDKPFDCPDDDETTPDVDGTTWHHQPAD